MLQLYDGLETGGAFVQAVLEEMGEPYRLHVVDLASREQKGAAYLALNPRGQVPTLVFEDGETLTETVAIGLALSERRPDARLMPEPGTRDWRQALRWLLFLATNLYEGENRKVNPERFSDGSDGAPFVQRAAVRYVNDHYRLIEGWLPQSPYVFGDAPSLVDLYIWMLVQWHGDFGWLARECPKTLRLVETVMARPAIAPVHDRVFGPGIGLRDMG